MNKYTEIIAGFSFLRGIFQGKTLQRVLSMPVLLAFYMESVDGIRILL
jgi:hypothetical protein